MSREEQIEMQILKNLAEEFGASFGTSVDNEALVRLGLIKMLDPNFDVLTQEA